MDCYELERKIMKLNLSPEHFEEIIKKSYSLDLVYMLKMIAEDLDISLMRERSIKINTLYDSLIRKGLISEEGKLTVIGHELLDFMGKSSATKIIKRKPATSEFDMWWNAYPSTDTFEYKGRKFVGSRSLRQGKDDCRIKFDKILIEGDYTADTLIKALKVEVEQKIESSYRTGTNKLSYMQNSLTYLRQRTFESFVPLINSETKSTENTYNGFDI